VEIADENKYIARGMERLMRKETEQKGHHIKLGPLVVASGV
jgi:hypothetical protein